MQVLGVVLGRNLGINDSYHVCKLLMVWARDGTRDLRSDAGGGGVNYETYPPRIWENLGTQNFPTPLGGGGGWTANHPPAHQTGAQDTSIGPVSRKFRTF